MLSTVGYVQVVEAEHAPEDTSITPLKPMEAMLSIDLSHPNIIHTYKYYTRIRQVLRSLNANDFGVHCR